MTATPSPNGAGSLQRPDAAEKPVVRPIEDAYPLTRIQQALLVRCLPYPDQPLYTGQWWAVLDGELDEQAFCAAWQGVVDRHTALRSGFHWDLNDPPFQVVRSEEHPSELQSLIRLSYAGFCLQKKTYTTNVHQHTSYQ